MLMAVVRIDTLGDEERDGGGDRHSPAVGWLKKGQKGGGIAVGCSIVAGSDRDYGSSHGLSQNEDLDGMNLSRQLDRSEVARRHQKII